ncbi:alpha-L-fucosidase [Micromonospora endophytica]|uniref:alpha-L-fucosidase n=1 Tax=Micromonospora endophytica TaxID=515350 RepID=A0A2W2DQM4_9ACTN|nr:alpha-L-fucosidase [Micromonospora endophytica]RIW44042.1 alpha-L-fucosidase [Micromonospora endophytica]
MGPLSPGRLSRRNLLAATALGTAATTLPLSTGLLTPAVAATPQSILENLINLRFGMFLHFNMGTFTDEEWATPRQNPTRFAPSAVNCGQWADAAVSAKMRYGVLTAKHHDGFCLWPTAHTSYNVMNSSYRQDIVAQYVNAFRARGLRVGLYYSIWDRSYDVQAYDTHHSVPADQFIVPGDITFILNQLRELLTNYGPIDILFTDGWTWQMGQQDVPYQQIRNLVRSLQPDCVMIDIGGLTQPLIGDAIFFEEPLGIRAPAGNTYAALQGQTISNGWFWHPSTPVDNPMSLSSILDHLADLEPKYTSFILNCPPNRNGVLDTNIVNRLAEVGRAWNPNPNRPPLPPQPLRAEYPVTPVNAYATSFRAGEGPLNAIDGHHNVWYQSCWSTYGGPALPQSITVDLGGVWSNVSTLEYLPKQLSRGSGNNGDITSYTILTSTDGVTFTQATSGSWAGDVNYKVAEWSPRNVGFVRLQINAATGGYANVSELRIGGRTAIPTLVSRLPITSGSYRIAARHSGGTVDVSGVGTADGTNIHQWQWAGANNQRWTFESTGDGYFEVRGVHSGKLMEVAGLSRDDNGNVALWADANVPQQHWAITPVGGGYYLFTNRLSGKALTVAGGSTANGANINQLTYSGLPQQQWQLIPS